MAKGKSYPKFVSKSDKAPAGSAPPPGIAAESPRKKMLKRAGKKGKKMKAMDNC